MIRTQTNRGEIAEFKDWLSELSDDGSEHSGWDVAKRSIIREVNSLSLGTNKLL